MDDKEKLIAEIRAEITRLKDALRNASSAYACGVEQELAQYYASLVKLHIHQN